MEVVLCDLETLLTVADEHCQIDLGIVVCHGGHQLFHALVRGDGKNADAVIHKNAPLLYASNINILYQMHKR